MTDERHPDFQDDPRLHVTYSPSEPDSSGGACLHEVPTYADDGRLLGRQFRFYQEGEAPEPPPDAQTFRFDSLRVGLRWLRGNRSDWAGWECNGGTWYTPFLDDAGDPVPTGVRFASSAHP